MPKLSVTAYPNPLSGEIVITSPVSGQATLDLMYILRMNGEPLSIKLMNIKKLLEIQTLADRFYLVS